MGRGARLFTFDTLYNDYLLAACENHHREQARAGPLWSRCCSNIATGWRVHSTVGYSVVIRNHHPLYQPACEVRTSTLSTLAAAST